MSSSYTYVGPYLLVKNIVVDEVKTRTIYKSESGNVYSKEIKFDPQDGTPVKEVIEEYKEKKEITSWYRLNEYYYQGELNDEDFYKPECLVGIEGHSVWIPNKIGYGKLLDGYDSSLIDIDAILINKEKGLFEINHREQIKIAQRYFSVVEVKYGVITYRG